jgi:hypothetical protein
MTYWRCVCMPVDDQIHVAVANRFQVLHRQLGAAGYAKQDPLSEQRGRLKDLRAQSTSVLTRARSARAEVSDATCVVAHAELMSSLEAMDIPALPIAAEGAASVEVLEAPVSTSSLRVALNTASVLAAIGSLGEVQVCERVKMPLCDVTCMNCVAIIVVLIAC